VSLNPVEDHTHLKLIKLGLTFIMLSVVYFVYAIVAFLVWNVLSTILNYRKALRIGLPVLFTPVDASNMLYFLTSSWLEPALRKVLPFGMGNFIRLNSRDWNAHNVHFPGSKVGHAFTLVSPKRIRVFVADAQAVDVLTHRRRDFLKAVQFYKPLELFGRNVITTEGEDWVRHRRITTPPFNEKVSRLVWEEARKQTEDMVQLWSENQDGIIDLVKDTMLLALHVLTGAGFGRSYKFTEGLQGLSAGHSMSYAGALGTILGNLFASIFVASIKVPMWMMPQKIRLIRQAVENFKCYMVSMVQEERDAIASGRPEGDNYMSILIRASEADRTSGKGGRFLTDSEIHGNMFGVNLAGHETTSNTLAYAITLLAAHPKWQDWIIDEVDRVLGSAGSLDYEEVYPQLKRCLALMASFCFLLMQYILTLSKNETLRLFGPVQVLPKVTEAKQDIIINDKPYTIPANTVIAINLAGLHNNPAYWGKDAQIWSPRRWITSSSTEELVSFPSASFIPWASGPRVCPGKKFSQVEFVAVIAFLLRSHRVEPVLLERETISQASNRIIGEVENSSYNFLLTMKHQDRIRLCLTRRVNSV
jgi:cytochrome P450